MSPSKYRTTAIIVGDPSYIVSFSANRNTMTVMDVPLDVEIPAVLGYGTYSIESLIALDRIDKHNGTLLTESISNAYGVPIQWYIIPRTEKESKDPISIVRSVFSWSGLIKRSTGGFPTSMPLSTWISWVTSVQNMRVDAITRLESENSSVNVPSPDGGLRKVLDESRLDYFIDQSFFDNGFRSDSLTVSMYNTTSVPNVGVRVSRMLTHLGISLIYVGNSEIEQKRCTISGSKKHLQTNTADFIRAYFDCENTSKNIGVSGAGAAADLVVKLGTDFASPYK